jgi:hypothetical protein
MTQSRIVVVTRMERKNSFSARCYYMDNGRQCPFFIEGSHAECVRKGTRHVHDNSATLEARVRFGKLSHHSIYQKITFTETDEA